MRRRSHGIVALSAFFVFGAVMSGLSGVSLLAPGGPLDSMWRVNPDGHAGLIGMGRWGIALMLVVCATCGLAAVGLWNGAAWGLWLAMSLLVVNLLGDVANAVLRGDVRTLMGVPIALALMAYLMSARVREEFRVHDAVR